MDRVLTWLRDNWLLALLLLVVVASLLIFRSTPTAVSDAAEFETLVSSGKPAVVEFFSNY